VDGSGPSIAWLVGFLTGFSCAIPPGPLNVTVIRKASLGHRRDAYRVGLGGALIDALICGLIAMGFGWVLERIVTERWVKAGFAAVLIAYGLKVLILDRRRDAALAAQLEDRTETPSTPPPARRSRLPVLVGLVQGAANPTLFVNWTLVISFLVGHRLLSPTLPSGGSFALGVGCGVFGWFTLLIVVLERLHDHPIGYWIRRSTIMAGLLLVLFGLYFLAKSVLAG